MQLKNKIPYSKTLILISVCLLFWYVSVLSLRNNYAGMVERREAVAVADRENGDVEKALLELRTHIYSHMNTSLTAGSNPIKPPIQLKGRYERLVAAEKKRVDNANKAITKQAESVCSSQYPAGGINPPRVACIQRYVAANASKEKPIPEDLYKFDFVSPSWTPDLAGFSLLGAIGSTIVVATMFVGRAIKKRLYD